MSRRRFAPFVLALIVALGLLPITPASAARNRPPKIKKAVMKDTDGDGMANKVILTYNERINHRLDTSRFPFRVQGYRILKVNKARRSTRLVIVVKESASAPAKPASIRYTRTRKQPVKDLKRLQAAKQLLTRNIIGLAVTPPPPTQHTLTVQKSGTGLGTVTSQPAGINCGATCQANYDPGTPVTLTATPDEATDATFGGWTGCASTTTTCTITMDSAKNVTANFVKAGEFALTVAKTGSGLGTVTSTSSPPQAGQINCGATCTRTYPAGTTVTLTAARDEASGSLFAGWSGGGCTGASTSCNVTMDQARTVTATFDKPGSFVLTVTKSGTGTVTSTSSPTQPGQINCGATCTATYPAATQVTLTATPPQGAPFSGWSGGGCTGTSNTCTIVMDAAKTVNATFGAVTQRSLTITKAGDGEGTVTSTSTPSQANQVNCGATCQVNYPDQSTVVLTATAATDSVFAGWSGGGCTGTSPTCNVTMDGAKTVTATFTLDSAPVMWALDLEVTNGTALCSADGGEPTACEDSYLDGTSLVITGAPSPGFLAPTWAGDCTGATLLVCNLEMTEDRAATLTFAPILPGL